MAKISPKKTTNLNNWHSSSIKDIFKKLNSNENGLSENEVRKRRNKYGFNEIQEIEKIKWYKILLDQFTNIMVSILIVAMIVSALVHEYLDAIAIGIIIIINAIIGFIQEYKAEKAVEALKELAAPNATVIRNNEVKKIAAKDLVPGDIVILDEGMNIPADIRLINLAQLKTIESSLTGESTPISKDIRPIMNFDSIGDLHNMVFMGTTITQGHGLGIVVDTGMQTQFGQIAKLVQTEKSGPTPLQKKLDSLSKLLAVIVVSIAVILFVLAFITGRDVIEMFILSISLAVSVIPEGLPAVITLTLAIGVQQIAKKHAIIRKLPAAETLGSTSVICTDKTGTLTQNQMTVETIYVNNQEIGVSGVGYKPVGDFLFENKKINPLSNDTTKQLLYCAALCNNSRLINSGKKWTISGDPTEACLITLARKAKINEEQLNKKLKRSEELVFDSDRKRMSTSNGDFQFTKGAPDSIIQICTHIEINGKIEKLTAKKKTELLKINDDLAKGAYRVLAYSYKKIKQTEKIKEEKMIFLGMTGMIDPPREEIRTAIEKCKSANIEVIMITGDHALTAKAIGEEIGLYKPGDQILTGAELDAMSDKALRDKVDQIRIFARVNPIHKVKILKALKSNNHIVAMTGDGVNDAPALKNADIGIAMGITGTDVSKEASDMILVDDNFATIVETVESGRVIYRNIKKFIRFLLSANFDEVLVISVIFLIGDPIPFLPLQILWVNLLTDALPAIALGMDVPDADIMKLKPRNPKESIWHDLIKFSVFAGIISAAISFIVYFHDLNHRSIEHTRTLMFTTIVLFEMVLAFSVRSGYSHYFTNFLKNKFLIFSILISLTLQFFAIYNSFLQKILSTVPLDLYDWIFITSLCIGGVFILEIWKHFRTQPDHV